MRALLDTCVLAELRKPDGHARVKAAVAELSDGDLYRSVMTVGEIARGVAIVFDYCDQSPVRTIDASHACGPPELNWGAPG